MCPSHEKPVRNKPREAAPRAISDKHRDTLAARPSSDCGKPFSFFRLPEQHFPENKMPHKPKQETHASPQSVAVLLWLSFALWLYSLLGVGLQSHGNWYGAEILFTGTFLGWIGCSPWIAGLAVYANYFYLFAWCRLAWGTKAPAVSITLMLLFASFTFQLQETAVGESGRMANVYAWGWGAVWWGLSLATLIIVTYARARSFPKKQPFGSQSQCTQPYFCLYSVCFYTNTIRQTHRKNHGILPRECLKSFQHS